MDNNIQDYRQLMVTSIGIILGFVLAFTGKWATEPVSESDASDYIVGVGFLLSVVLLITALYRILDNNYPESDVAAYYKTTLRLFISGVSLAFSGVLLSIIQTILNH